MAVSGKCPITLSLFLVFCTSVGSSRIGHAQSAEDPVARLNGAFRKAYANARAETLRRSGPIIFVRGDGLILLDGEKRVEGSTVDRAYHDLKTVAHVPLAIYALLTSPKGGMIDEELQADLRTTRESMAAAMKAFHNRLDDPALERRQRRLLQASLDFVDQRLATQRHDRQALLTFIKNSVPQIQENLDGAVKHRIDN